MRATNENTVIIGGGGARESVERRLSQLRAEMARATIGTDEDWLSERIARLSGKAAIITVGAPTNAELKEIRHRVDDSLQATRAAMAEGIVAGGGAALLHAEPALDALDVRVTTGSAWRSCARRSPSRCTSSPATRASTAPTSSSRSADMGVDDGFDALEGRYGNMVDMGIIDPLRVVRSALQNGASVAGLILTTNSLVAEEQTPWNKALMTEYGPLDEGIPQPSPDSSTPQSLGLGPSRSAEGRASASPAGAADRPGHGQPGCRRAPRTLYRCLHERRMTKIRGPAVGACPGSTYEGVDAMGRGRQKAKQTKVARQLKYFSPDTDYDALQRELASGGQDSYPECRRLCCGRRRGPRGRRRVRRLVTRSRRALSRSPSSAEGDEPEGPTRGARRGPSLVTPLCGDHAIPADHAIRVDHVTTRLT